MCVLGLLVNGMTIYGRIESPGTVFAELDAENARMMERQRSAKDKESKEASPLEDVWTRKFEEGERQEEQIMERTEGKALEEMTEEDVRATIERQTTTLTLADVHVFPPASAGFEVPLMRVRSAQVNAWWLIPRMPRGMCRSAIRLLAGATKLGAGSQGSPRGQAGRPRGDLAGTRGAQAMPFSTLARHPSPPRPANPGELARTPRTHAPDGQELQPTRASFGRQDEGGSRACRRRAA